MKKWLDKYNDDIPQAQNGIEGTMGGLTDVGFNYNGAWGGTMQMGGAMPGAVGFTYARVAGAAPANGPYAKKTKASAQNGAEMKFYQEGLDWKPRNISQDGSKNPKKRTIILAEHNPEFWDNPDSGKAVTAINPFITEAAGIKKYVNKYFPNEDVEVVPTYRQNIKEALAKSDPNTRLVIMGHSGDRMFGIPTGEFIESVGNTKYENCYAGVCYGDDLIGIKTQNPDRDIIGKTVPDRYPESYNLNNFNLRSDHKKWLGFAPVDRGGEEGFKDSFFRRTENPEVIKLAEKLREIWANDNVDFDEKKKSAESIQSKLDKIYSQNRQIVNLPKAADTKELDYIPIPARTANYGKDPLTFNPQRKEQGGEINKAQLGIKERAVSDNTSVRQPRTDMLTMDEYRLQQALANQPVVQPALKTGQLSAEEIKRKNKAYAQQTGKKFNEKTGAVSPILSPQQGKTFDKIAENLVMPMLEIEAVMAGAPLLALGMRQGLKGAGKYLTEKAVLKNTDKLNSLLPKTIQNNIIAQKYRIRNYLDKDIRDYRLESVDEGNEWSQAWFSHPATLAKYDDFVVPSVPYSKTQRVLDKFLGRPMPAGNVARENLKILQETGSFTKPEKTIVKNPFDIFLGNSDRTQGYYSISGNKSYVDVYNPYATGSDIMSTTIHENAHGVTGAVKGINEDFNRVFNSTFDVGKNDYEKYLVEPTESYARMNELRKHFGLKPGEELSTKALRDIIEEGKKGTTPVDSKWFDLIKHEDKLKWLFNNAPIATGAIATPLVAKEFKVGGEIKKDDMGYWNPENWGEPVEINSNQITMQGVYEPLLGISDTGDTQMMYPGEDYEFDGEYVTEYPVAKSGMSVNNADAQPIEKLDQLLNFTNYNKPTKGGWLDKYQ